MKKFILILIIVLIVVSCLFPPWQNKGLYGKTYEPMGYSFIATPPMGTNGIDFNRLFIQLGLLAFLGGCTLFSGLPSKQLQP